MASISPGVYTKIKDLSSFVQAVPGTIGFICALTEKGVDNKVTYLSGREELVENFGEPNISLYGADYSQGPYVAHNYLGESGAFYFMRCLPDDASFSNLRIYGNTDASNVYFIDYVTDVNDTTDIATAMEAWGNNTPLVIFYPIGRGSYYNNLGIEITEDERRPGEGIYHLDIYETQSDDTYTMIESYTISFDESAVSLNPGESIFVEYVLETYSKVLRASVSQNGFNLLERIYYDSQTDTSREGATATGATGGGTTGGGSTQCQVSISSAGETSYIDETSVTHTVVYDGNFWATTSNLPEVKGNSPASFGDITEAFICGGFPIGVVEPCTTQVRKWDGSAWATTTSMSIASYESGGCGDPTNGGLIIGGKDIGYASIDDTQKWSGAAWATTTVINTIKQGGLAAVGTIDDAICAGGGTSASSQLRTELWDGSTWTTTTSTSIYHKNTIMFGDTTSCLICGGITADGGTEPGGSQVEKYYPTYPTLNVWATTSDMVRVIANQTSFGTQNDALSIGGSTSGFKPYTEIWNGAAWATTTNINDITSMSASFGSTSEGIKFAGDTTGVGASNKSEKWNGSVWATTTNYLLSLITSDGAGVFSNGLGIGGKQEDNTIIGNCNIWNGSVWATTTSLLTAKAFGGSVGITSSTMTMAGFTGASIWTNKSEKWNGSAWATTNSLPLAESLFSCSKNSTIDDIITFGGNKIAQSQLNNSYEWNGSAWSTGQNLNIGRQAGGGSGTGGSAALAFGGSIEGGSGTKTTEKTVATSTTIFVWSTTSSMNNIIKYHGGCGPTNEHGIVFGGQTGADYTDRVDRTEAWNGVVWSTTSAQNVARTGQTGCGTQRNALSMGGNLTSGTDRSNTTEIWYPSYSTHTHVEHTLIPVIIDIYQLSDTQNDFSPYETDPEAGEAEYVVIATDSAGATIWGWMGDSTGVEHHVINIWKGKDLDTASRGWNGDITTFNQSDCNISYIIKRSYDETGEGIPGLFSVQPLKKGTEGSLVSRGTFSTTVADQILAQGYAGEIDVDVLDTERIYFNLVYDAGYSQNVKNQIVGLAQSREDCVAIVDNGDNASYNAAIIDRNNTYIYNTYFASLFEPYSRIFDIFTNRQVWFSPCYHMAYILPRNDRIGELWYAAAGNNRGVARDIQELRYNLSPGQREQFYIHQINPIIKFNTSYILYSQLTTQSKPSAFQDLNIVRMVLYIKKALDQYVNTFIFNQNNQITWNQVRSEIANFLEQIKKRRGLFNYTIEVGATALEFKNKTFHINITLNPVKTTERIELNFYIK